MGRSARVDLMFVQESKLIARFLWNSSLYCVVFVLSFLFTRYYSKNYMVIKGKIEGKSNNVELKRVV